MRYVAKVSLITVLASILGMAALFLIQFHYASIYEEHDRSFGSFLVQVDSARLIQVDFKKQVQEWKDILLRGHEPKDLEAYTAAFYRQESRVQQEAARLAGLLEDPRARSILAEFTDAHQNMGASYREALGRFRTNPDPRIADRSVRGQDRLPTDKIDAIVKLLTGDSDRWQAASRATLLAQERRVRWLSLSFFAGLLGVALYFTLRFTSPIGKLSRMVRTITQKKDYGIRAEVTGDDEVSELMVGINGMLGEVQTGRALLQASRDRLEHQVTEIADREEQLRALTNSVSEGIVSADESVQIASWNKGAETIFGYSEKEILGQPLSAVAEEGSREVLKSVLARSGSTPSGGEGLKKVELVGRAKDGKPVPLEASVATWKKNGRLYYGSILTDISERKRIDQMKTDFVSTVSHELRTPLTSIRGSLGLVASGVLGELPPKVKPMVEIAAKNCERLVRLVSDILDVEKMASGQMAFKNRTLSLLPFLGQLIEANRGFGSSLGVNLALESEKTEILVHADADRLSQVLTNLVSNACKFSPRGETVTVRVSRQGKKVRVAIQDRGPGIPEEFRSRIFQKFAQSDASDAAQHKGTGLGLVISKGLIERMGGSIGFETKLGAGTTFFIELEIEPAVAVSSAASGGTRPRILVCEDDRDVAEVLRATLDREGFDCDVATTLKGARELSSRQPYAGLTLDLGLPDGNGLDLLKELRQNPATAQLPIIVISAHLEQNKLDLTGHAFGLVDWLEKPIPEDRLREALRSCCPPGSTRKPRVLHVEDDADITRVVATLLRDTADVVPASTVLSAWELLKEEDFDLMIIDLGLPDGSGLELLPALKKSTRAPIPSLVFSSHEISPRTERYVSAALLKSQTSNQDLVI